MKLLSLSVIVLAGVTGMGLGANAGTYNPGGYTAFSFGFWLTCIGTIAFSIEYLANSRFAEVFHWFMNIGTKPNSNSDRSDKPQTGQVP